MTTGPWARGGVLAEAPWAAGRGGSDDLAALLVRGGAAVAAAAAVGCGAVLATRRIAAGIVAPSPAVLATAVAAGIVLVAVADLARRAGRGLRTSVAARCGLALAVAALALPPPATGPAGQALVALAVAAAAVVILRVPGRRGERGRRVWPAAPRPAAAQPAPAARHSSTAAPRSETLPGSFGLGPRHGADDGRLWQVFERHELPAGTDRVRGRLHVSIPAGAKVAHGHVGFCPAFTQTPQVVVSTDYDGVEATIVAAEVLPWGVRVECRLAEPAEEPVEIPVDLHAAAPA